MDELWEGLRELSEDAGAFDTERLERPLRMWRAWDQRLPLTSQRRALQLIQDTHELQIWGGNRSGKTELGRCLLVALVLGSDHLDARDFWLTHGVDPDLFPRGPGWGWAIAVTSNDSLRYHRQQILSLLPKWGPAHPMSEGQALNWHAWNLMGRGESRIEIMVPGYDTPACIWFRSEDQGVGAFRGDAIRVAWHDEEGKTLAVYNSTSYRLIDQDGYQIMTNTPEYGKTWTYYHFEKTPPEGARLTRLWVEHNPHIPKHRSAKYKDDPIRGRGEYVDSADRIWWMFHEHSHIVPAFSLPEGTPLFKAIDFGTRHPFVILWAGVLRRPVTLKSGRILLDGTIVVFREHYVTGRALAWHVARMREAEGWIRDPEVEREEDHRPHEAWIPGPTPETIDSCWADPEDPQLLLQLQQTYQVQCSRARRAIKAGITRVADLMTPDETGEPRIVFMDCVPNAIREVQGYMWTKRKTVDGTLKDEPSDENNHTCDLLRYIAMGLRGVYPHL